MKKIFFFFLLVVFISCEGGDDFYSPKPRAYFRIDLPEKVYQTYDTSCAYTFDYPKYSVILPDFDPKAEPCWVNIFFPRFKATIHLSYKKVNGNIAGLLKDSDVLAKKHIVKASGLEEELIMRDSSKVFGLVYNIEGNAASPMQFYLTDSTQHFVRGSLYFMSRPNGDSLAPVLEFLKQDVQRFVQSLKWKGDREKKK